MEICKNFDYDDMVALYDQINSGVSDEFAIVISKKASNLDIDGVEALAKFLRNKGSKLDPEELYKVKFICFFVLCVYYRRRKEYNLFSGLINDYEKEFGNEDLYLVQKATSLKDSYNREEDIVKAIDIWNGISDRIKQMPAYTQAYSDALALYFELIPSELETKGDLLKRAIRLQELAISKREYPKYHYTLARLYKLSLDYDKARLNIRRAIDLEDSSEKDYALRIIEYQVLEAKIEMDSMMHDEMEKLNSLRNDLVSLSEKTEKAKEEIDKSKIDNISFLGFFTGIISFILGTFQIGDGLNYNEKVHLVFVLMGGLIIVFVMFKLFLEKIDYKKVIFVLLVAIAAFLLMLAGVKFF